MVGRPSAASTTRLSDQMIRDCVVDGPKKKNSGSVFTPIVVKRQEEVVTVGPGAEGL